jgi:hypothetical protein
VSRVRGRTLVPIRAGLKENFGDVGWKRVLGELPPPDREVLDGLLVPDNWYDRRLHTGLLEASSRLFGAGTPDLGHRLGVRVAQHHDRFYLRPLLRLGGPMMIVRRASSLYREYFQGGTCAVIEQREHGARLEYDDPLAPALLCRETLPAFIEELIRLGGKEVVRMSRPVCRYEGADHCELDFEWR